MSNGLNRKRHLPDVRTIKKHSDIVGRDPSNMVVVGGTREKTETGYIVKGFSGKSFETYFEYMLPGTSTPLYKHDKKDKTVRLLSGVLFVILKDNDSYKELRAIPGDEIILNRGIEYRLSSSSEPVQLIVCQNAKYNITLKIIDKELISREVSPELLNEPTFEDRLRASRPYDAPSLRKGSRAKEQLQEMRSGRKSSQVIDKVIPENVTTIFGKNTRPTSGRFDEEGAG
jgi:hypothetical protein